MAEVVAPLQLAEVRWTFRRWYTYLLTAVVCALLAFIIDRLTDPTALKVIGLALVAQIALQQIIYLVGATATDLARRAAAVRSATAPGDKS